MAARAADLNTGMDNETKSCTRCGEGERRPGQSWCGDCFRAYQREQANAKAAGAWRPTYRSAYPTEGDRVTARQWRQKCQGILAAEARLERLRAEAAALRASFKRRDGK